MCHSRSRCRLEGSGGNCSRPCIEAIKPRLRKSGHVGLRVIDLEKHVDDSGRDRESNVALKNCAAPFDGNPALTVAVGPAIRT